MTLGLIFTFGVSVEIWHRQGLLDREKLLYEKFLEYEKIKKIYWFTYGINDKIFSNLVKSGIEIITPPKIFKHKFGMFIYSFLMPFLQSKYFKEIDIIKTNQIKGSWTAWIVSLIYRKKFILRAGYLWSLVVKRKYNALYSSVATIIEYLMCKLAHIVILTSKSQEKYIIKKYRLRKNKIFIISNYVDTEMFRPNPEIHKLENRLVFVGRINKEKNLKNLILAMKGLPFGLDIYGDGVLKNELEKIARKNAVDVNFNGFVSNAKLPEILQRYKYFILPSLYEGMPKALLEAMACEMVVIGTKVEGIQELINHGENGWFIEDFSVEGIRKRLLSLGKDKDIEKKMSLHARKYIEDNFSLSFITERELNILKIC